MRATLRHFVAVVMWTAAITNLAAADGLPPGQHSAQPKYWRVLNRTVTNYSPFQFDYRIANLTPTRDGGLWFSLGASIERIDPNGHMKNYPMPYYLWQVSGITRVDGNTWFSAGQSGKVGKIDSKGRLSFVQVVPRRFYPDIRDLIVSRTGEMWFLDAGRRSVGYRSSTGRLVEHPVPDGAWARRMQHCMGKLWLVADTPFLSRLAIVDDSLYPHWYASNIPKHLMIRGTSCDSRNDLWLTLNNRFLSPRSYAARFRSNGEGKLFTLAASSVGDIASDARGNQWITSETGLVQIEEFGASHAYDLPTGPFSPDTIAVATDGTIWLAINSGSSPLSIVRLQKM